MALGNVPLENFVTRLQATATVEEGWTAVVEFFRGLGFDHLMYAAGRLVPGTAPDVVILNTFPAWFNQHYGDQGYAGYDPVFRHCCTELRQTRIGIHWVGDVGPLTDAQWHMTREAASFGYRAGLACPLSALGTSRVAGLSVTNGMSARESDPFLADCAAVVGHAAWYAHAHLEMRLRQARAEAIGLTPREREVLLWAAAGLSSKETARKLSVTDKAVEFHVANAIRKLQVRNRVHAVARAVLLGLVDP